MVQSRKRHFSRFRRRCKEVGLKGRFQSVRVCQRRGGLQRHANASFDPALERLGSRDDDLWGIVCGQLCSK